MGVRGSALNSCAQEQFNDLLRSPAAILNSCRHTPNKKKREGHERLQICSGRLTQSYMIASGLMGILVQPTVVSWASWSSRPCSKRLAIQVAIRRQFQAIREVFQQFGLWEEAKMWGRRQFGPLIVSI